MDYIDSYLIPKKAWVKIVGVSVTGRGVQPLVKVNGKVGVYSGERYDDVVGYIMQESGVEMLYANPVGRNNIVNNTFLGLGVTSLKLKLHRFYSIKSLRKKTTETKFCVHKSCL